MVHLLTDAHFNPTFNNPSFMSDCSSEAAPGCSSNLQSQNWLHQHPGRRAAWGDAVSHSSYCSPDAALSPLDSDICVAPSQWCHIFLCQLVNIIKYIVKYIYAEMKRVKRVVIWVNQMTSWGPGALMNFPLVLCRLRSCGGRAFFLQLQLLDLTDVFLATCPCCVLLGLIFWALRVKEHNLTVCTGCFLRAVFLFTKITFLFTSNIMFMCVCVQYHCPSEHEAGNRREPTQGDHC